MHQARPSWQLPTAAEPTATDSSGEPIPWEVLFAAGSDKFGAEYNKAEQDDAAPQCDAVGLYI